MGERKILLSCLRVGTVYLTILHLKSLQFGYLKQTYKYKFQKNK